MDEKKFAVLLTDTQEVKVLECDPQEEMLSIARDCIGCDWIELIDLNPGAGEGYVMLIDEEGKLRDRDLLINCVASDLYGADRHGDPIIGNAVIVKAADDTLELMTHSDAQGLAGRLEQRVEHAPAFIPGFFLSHGGLERKHHLRVFPERKDVFRFKENADPGIVVCKAMHSL